MKLKVGFFERINEIDKTIAKFIKEKKKERAKTQISNIKNESENIIIDLTDIKKIIR